MDVFSLSQRAWKLTIRHHRLVILRMQNILSMSTNHKHTSSSVRLNCKPRNTSCCENLVTSAGKGDTGICVWENSLCNWYLNLTDSYSCSNDRQSIKPKHKNSRAATTLLVYFWGTWAQVEESMVWFVCDGCGDTIKKVKNMNLCPLLAN